LKNQNRESERQSPSNFKEMKSRRALQKAQERKQRKLQREREQTDTETELQ
jgi:hypothetical protein